MTEKRRAHRVPVSMTVEKEESSVLGFGYAVNLSEVGMAIDAEALSSDTQALPKIGSFLRLRFKLPGSLRVLTVHSRILRIDHMLKTPRIAVEFEGLAQEDRQEISQTLRFNSSPK